jgi:site-specific recombinase XerC
MPECPRSHAIPEKRMTVHTGLLSPELATGIRRVKGARSLGVRIGNWLTVDQSRSLLREGSADSLRGKRDRAILALLIGCGLGRAELVRLEFLLLGFRLRWRVSFGNGNGHLHRPRHVERFCPCIDLGDRDNAG